MWEDERITAILRKMFETCTKYLCFRKIGTVGKENYIHYMKVVLNEFYRSLLWHELLYF